MTQKKLKNLAMALGLLGAMLIPATMFAQGTEAQSAKNYSACMTPLAARAYAQVAARHAQTSSGPTYNYTLVSYPGTLFTLGVGINPGAIPQSGITIVGAQFFDDESSQTGFFARVSEMNGITENYKLLLDPQGPATPQQTYGVNDYGKIVGDYIDASGIFHSYVLDGGQYIPLDVPFSGAAGTASPAINNAGEIVGLWYDSAGNTHNYTLISGKFEAFDVPGAAEAQIYFGINSKGIITGSYADASGNIHGFLRTGNTYTVLNYPGAAATFPSGINDSGVIVGGYCPTSDCLTTGVGETGFFWKGGTFTSFTIPNESVVALASINDDGVVMGNYLDAAGLVYTFLGTPVQ